MAKNVRIRITESELNKIITESVKRTLVEIGDTKRGQWMLGRLKNRQANGEGKFNRSSVSYNDAGDAAYNAAGGKYTDAYHQGYDDEEKFGHNPKMMKFNADVKRIDDADDLGEKFINFIEKHHGGSILQTIVDCESGNETGTPCSPLPMILPEFEEAILGYKATPEMKQEIKKAYNKWWFYAQDQLMPEENI